MGSLRLGRLICQALALWRESGVTKDVLGQSDVLLGLLVMELLRVRGARRDSLMRHRRTQLLRPRMHARIRYRPCLTWVLRVAKNFLNRSLRTILNPQPTRADNLQSLHHPLIDDASMRMHRPASSLLPITEPLLLFISGHEKLPFGYHGRRLLFLGLGNRRAHRLSLLLPHVLPVVVGLWHHLALVVGVSRVPQRRFQVIV